MRAFRILLVVGAGLAGCDSSESKLKDVSWGRTIEGDYDLISERAQHVTLQHFPKGFDPDRTNEANGDYWTIWHFKQSMWYRGTTRERAHLKVEDLGNGEVRVGVAIVRQLNDNIDNPHLLDEARWVRTHRDQEMEGRLEAQIARRYLDRGPSEQWKARKGGSSATIRDDIVDRYKDVDLESGTRLGDDEESGAVTGRDRFYGEYKESGWKDKYGYEKKRKEREEAERRKKEREEQERKKKEAGQK